MKKSITLFLEQLHDTFLPLCDGNVADYIPELARVAPDKFGIALVTVDGHVHQVGDSLEPFTIQSISKAFTLGIAMEDQDADELHRKIDVEPSGEAFNSISLEPDTGRPRNPMINAGAIAATSLVRGETADEKFDRIIGKFGDFAACRLKMDESVYRSEKSTGHRNRAIANLLRNYEILEEDPELALDAYFRQCSIQVTAQELAVMGATLANKGVNPITSVQVLSETHVPGVLAVMSSCGMYDYSGNWLRKVGMPAKSGVGGGIMAVLPGQFGLAVFSPRLDEKGNSVRGIQVCKTVTQNYAVHMFNSARHTSSNILKAIYTMGDVSSRFERASRESEYLRASGQIILVCELTGEQSFITTESLSSLLLNEMAGRETLILDFSRITGSDHATARLLVDTVNELTGQGKSVIVTGLSDKYRFRRKLTDAGAEWRTGAVSEMATLDQALQACEDALLEKEFTLFSWHLRVPLEDQPLLEGLNEDELAWLGKRLEPLKFSSGEIICRKGDASRLVYLIEKGKVDVLLPKVSDENQRHSRVRKVASFCGGAVVGEAAFFEHAPRSADAIAASEVVALGLDPEHIAGGPEDGVAAHIRARIYQNLAALAFERLGKINRVLMTLNA
jgi:glutaminase